MQGEYGSFRTKSGLNFIQGKNNEEYDVIYYKHFSSHLLRVLAVYFAHIGVGEYPARAACEHNENIY
jgi:hypothetical protein